MPSHVLALVLITLGAATVNGALGYGFSSITVPLALLFLTNRALNPALVLVEVPLNATDKTLTLVADDEFKMNGLWEIVQTRLVRRGVPIKNFTGGTSEPSAGGTLRRVFTVQQGIPIDAAREIVKLLKEKKLKKVQAAIQADQVRVSSPSKDELQEAMRALREHDFGVALQFGNYR